MQVPIQRVIRGLYDTNYSGYNNNGDKRLFWSILLQARGEIEVDINELIEAFYDTESNNIVELVQEFGSSADIDKFIKNTKGLISDTTYEALKAKIADKAKKEVDFAIKKSKEMKNKTF